MRWLVVVFALAGCSGGNSCKEVVRRAATRFGNADVPEVATLIGECEQRDWSAKVRDCIGDGAYVNQLEDCLPAVDVKIPLPKLEPSNAVVDAAAKAPGPVRALLFFSHDSEVHDVIAAYFKGMRGIEVEAHDRFVDVELATRYKVAREGAVVLVRGDKYQFIDVGDDLDHAERRLMQGFDREVLAQLTKLARKTRRAYIVVGHGELTDPDSIPPELRAQLPPRKAASLTKLLAELNYEVKRLEPSELVNEVPDDATILLLLAPAVALAPREEAAVSRYLDRGGGLLVALDPTSPPGLGALEAKLGLVYNHGHLTDEVAFLPQRRQPSDHRLVPTTEFSAHPMTSAMRRMRTQPMILVDSGALEAGAPSPTGPKVTFTIRTPATTFVDTNNNFKLDPGETKQKWNVAAAVEGPKFHAVVLADVDLVADVLVQTGGAVTAMMLGGPLLSDSVRWLGGEEQFVADDPPPPSKSVPTSKERRDAKLELADRRMIHAMVRAIALSDKERDKALETIRAMQARKAELAAPSKP